jgi:hypothetical protein
VGRLHRVVLELRDFEHLIAVRSPFEKIARRLVEPAARTPLLCTY